MADAREIGARFIDAFNAHDEARIRELNGENGVFEAPGDVKLEGREATTGYAMACLHAFGSESAGRAARALLPHAEHVPGRVAEDRHPEVAFGIRLRHELAAAGNDLLERLVDVLDEDMRPYSALAGDGVLGTEVADDVAGAVLERRVLSISPRAPAEDLLVKRSRRLRIRGGDPEVGDAANPEAPMLALG